MKCKCYRLITVGLFLVQCFAALPSYATPYPEQKFYPIKRSALVFQRATKEPIAIPKKQTQKFIPLKRPRGGRFLQFVPSGKQLHRKNLQRDTSPAEGNVVKNEDHAQSLLSIYEPVE